MSVSCFRKQIVLKQVRKQFKNVNQMLSVLAKEMLFTKCRVGGS